MESSPWKLIDKKLKAVNVVTATMGFSLESCGVSLPDSPEEGEIFTLVDSLTAPTYMWTFRYNPASISLYKWEFLGGTSSTIFGVDSNRTLDTLTHTGLSNEIGEPVYYQSGNTFLLPYSGEYEFSGSVIIESSLANVRVSTQVFLSKTNELTPEWSQVLELGFNHIPLPVKRLRGFKPGKIMLGIGSTYPEDTIVHWSSLTVQPVRIQ
jgi:hypothetical protein